MCVSTKQTNKQIVPLHDVMIPNFIPVHSAPRTGGSITGPSFLPKQKVFWSNLPSGRSHCAAWVAWLTYAAGLQHKNPTSALAGFLVKTKLPVLRLSCWKVLTLDLTSKVPLKESDNLPQVSRSQTSPAAKLILNSALTLHSRLQDQLRIQLSFGTFPFLVDLQPSSVIWRLLFLSIRVARVVKQ